MGIKLHRGFESRPLRIARGRGRSRLRRAKGSRSSAVLTHPRIAVGIYAADGQRECFTSRSAGDGRRGGLSSKFDSVENELHPEVELLVERNARELVGGS